MEKKSRRRLIEPEASVPRNARDGGPVITGTNVSRETRRRTSADWFNQKQVWRGRIEREDKWLLVPISAERHGEGLAETGSSRGKCAAEGTREGLVTNSTNVSRETQSWRNGGDWWTRSKFSAEGTRRMTTDYLYHVYRETRWRRAGGDWLNQKQVFRGRHETEDQRLLVPISPEKHGE